MKGKKTLSINIESDSLILADVKPNLKSEHISQLFFFGFEKNAQDGSFYYSKNEIGATLLKVIDYLDEENISYQLSSISEELLAGLINKIEEFKAKKELAKRFKEGRFKKVDIAKFDAFVKTNIARKLKSHQLKAAFHLYLLESGANFSVPGSGKTSVILTVYEKLKQEGKVNILFVVGPPSCFGPWRKEYELTLGRIPQFKIFAGGQQLVRKRGYFSDNSSKSELYLTTFQTLANDREEVRRFFDRQGNNIFFVVDEAHYIKQIGGNWASAVLFLSQYAKHKCILTGTPLPRSYTDIFNMFDFLYDKVNPLNPEMKIRIKLLEDAHNDSSAKDILKQEIGPLFYRVRKSDLGLKKPIFHSPFVIKMNQYERLVYEAIERKIITYSKEDYLKNIDLVLRLRRGRIMRLRQCASYVKLLAKAIDGYRENLIRGESDLRNIIYNYDTLEKPAKLIFLTSLIKKISSKDKKIIVWANFVDMLKLIKKYLTREGFGCELIFGGTPTEQTPISEAMTREKIISKFKDIRSGLDILILNPAACAESISLHQTCFHAIYYDLSYNCAQYLQSLDRIHRVGGSEINIANYYFLQYENSIDQDIKDNLDRKAEKMYSIIEQDYSIYSLDMFAEADEIAAYERLFSKT
jgi:SNF2 family DNA or RNA helicase